MVVTSSLGIDCSFDLFSSTDELYTLTLQPSWKWTRAPLLTMVANKL